MSTNENLKMQIIQKAWEDPIFKEQLLTDPKSAILNSFGIMIPNSIELVTVEENVNKFYLVIPPKPTDEFTDEFTEEITEEITEVAEPNARW